MDFLSEGIPAIDPDEEEKLDKDLAEFCIDVFDCLKEGKKYPSLGEIDRRLKREANVRAIMSQWERKKIEYGFAFRRIATIYREVVEDD